MRTTGAILELGAGNYSTPLIHEIAMSQGRRVLTLDNSGSWLSAFAHLANDEHHFRLVSSWDEWHPTEEYGLAFIDHGPCDRREAESRRLLSSVDVFVMHDTEDPAYGYGRVHCIMDHLETDTRHIPWTTVSRGRIPLFPVLELETCSTCDRVCPTCIRNSHPNRVAVASWFHKSLMPLDIIRDCTMQAADLGFLGNVCLSHYNEPLLDERLPDIAEMVKRILPHSKVFFHSNGDILTEAMANSLDRVVDGIAWSVYIDDPSDRVSREQWIASQFRQTKCEFTGGGHIATHFSPHWPVAEHAAKHRWNPCSEPARRMIINHLGQMLLCCDDVVGNFDLGKFPDSSLSDLWWSNTHQELVRKLSLAGGRATHNYCESCPRA